MNFFKKTSVAVLIALLVVALCCVWGYTRANNESAEVSTHYQPDRSSGESNLNYYLSWVSDGARLFSANTIDTMARENLTLDNTYGGLVAVKTVSYLNGRDIQSYAEETAQNLGLDRRDMLLFLDTGSQSWYVTYGADLATYVESSADLPNLFREHLNTAFWEEDNADEGILDLFDDLDDWYEENIPPLEKDTGFLPSSTKIQAVSLGSILSGIFFTLLANLWWIALAFIALNIVDRVRFDRFYAKKTSREGSDARFHPFLFWHRPGSNWYEDRMEEAMEEEELDDEEDDDTDPPGGSASQHGGENYQSGPGYSTDPNEPGPFGPQSGPNQQSWQAPPPPPPGPVDRSLMGQVMDLVHTLVELVISTLRTIQNTLFRR